MSFILDYAYGLLVLLVVTLIGAILHDWLRSQQRRSLMYTREVRLALIQAHLELALGLAEQEGQDRRDGMSLAGRH